MPDKSNRTKPLGVALAYVPLVLIYFLITYAATNIGGKTWNFGVILMALAIPAAIVGSKFKPLYILAIAANAAGTGFITAYYYIYFEITVSITHLLIPTFVCASVVIFVAFLIYLLPGRRGIILLISGLLSLGALITALVLWIIHGTVLASFSFFISILLLTAVILLYAVVRGDDENEILRDTAFASFGVLIIVGFVVLVVVGGDGCDCDSGCVDCCDCSTGDGKAKRRAKK